MTDGQGDEHGDEDGTGRGPEGNSAKSFSVRDVGHEAQPGRVQDVRDNLCVSIAP